MENTRDILCFFLRKQYCQKLCVYTINGKHTRHSVFLFEKAILSKVVRRGKLINCANVRNFPHLGTKQKERIVKILQSLIEEWCRGIFRTVLKAFPSFASVEFFGGLFTALNPTMPPQESQCCSFLGIGFQICPT